MMSTAEIERMVERLGMNSALAEAERRCAEQQHMMERLGMNSALAEAERRCAEQQHMMERLGMNSALAEAERRCAELQELENSETREATPTTEELELAAETQICAIEVLALQIEIDLPEWLESNGGALAWRLAIAAHNFIVGFLRATGQVPALSSPDSTL